MPPQGASSPRQGSPPPRAPSVPPPHVLPLASRVKVYWSLRDTKIWIRTTFNFFWGLLDKRPAVLETKNKRLCSDI